MKNSQLKITCRQVIDASSTGSFAQHVLRLTYDEFCMKSQTYNREGRFSTFSEIVAADGRANSLHYKTGFAIGQIIAGLKGIIPDLTDALGKPVSFGIHRFQILESNVKDITRHRVALFYITDYLTCHGQSADQLILSASDPAPEPGKDTDVFMLRLTKDVAVSHLREVPEPVASM